MALVNNTTHEMTAKIVYYGPGLSGKTTNLKFLYENIDESMRGEMLSLPAEGERTVLFDILPVEMGSYKGLKVRIQLYTVPGQVRREEARKTVLKGVDGIVFVADSQRQMAEANTKAFDQLRWHLLDMGLFLEDIPLVIQYNKRDIKSALSLDELDKDLNPGSIPFFEAVATDGVGVEDTFKAIAALVLRRLVAQGFEHIANEEEIPKEREDTLDEAAPADLLQEKSEALEGGADDSPLLMGEDSGNPLLDQSISAVDSIFAEPASMQEPARRAPRELKEEPTFPGVLVSDLSTEAQPSTEVPEVAVDSQPPFIKLSASEPIEARVEIEGKRYRLVIELIPED